MNRFEARRVCQVERQTRRAPGEGAETLGRREDGIDGSWWRWARPLGGAAILAVLVRRLGAGPFVDALHAADGRTLAWGAGIAVGTTVCGAWRWWLVSRRLGVGVPMRTAVAACYRSQFLNATLPGGVLGDVHRGVHQGRDVGDVGRSLRAVAWERGAGQVVLVFVTAVVLLVVHPFASHVPVAAMWAVLAGGAVCLVLLMSQHGPGGGRRVWGRMVDIAVADLRALLAVRASAGIVVASVAVVAGHVATFLVAARAIGATTPEAEILPLALVVLLVSAVPLNVAGWGPREGAAAWAFAAAGMGAAQGVATAVTYGAIAFVATLPGAALLVVGRVHPSRVRQPAPSRRRPPGQSATAGAVGGVAHG